MTKGTVKWYNESKGFGFIETEDSDDIFIHRTNIKSSHGVLNEGDSVTFDITEGEKGLVATNLRVV